MTKKISMTDWKKIAKKIKCLLIFNNASYITSETAGRTSRRSNQQSLLSAVKDVFHSSDNREKSLRYAELVINYHPNHWSGYVYAAKELLALRRFNEAKKIACKGLKWNPIEINLLVVANDAYRALNDRKKSLKLAELLIFYHPGSQQGYIRTAQDLIALNQAEEAHKIIKDALNKFPKQEDILILAYDLLRAMENREESLKYAETLITLYPEKWGGYGRASQDLIALNQFKEAQKKINQGLQKIPNQKNLLMFANYIYRVSGDHRQSWRYAELFRAYHPQILNAHALAIKEKLVANKFTSSSEGLIKYGKNHRHFRDHPFLNGLRLAKYNPLKILWADSFFIPSGGNTLSIDLCQFQPFQYWSQGNQPSEIVELRESWNRLFRVSGVPEIKLFDRSSASEWIAEYVPSLLKAFLSAFHYAVEADVFRVAYALKSKCIWIDSDMVPYGNIIEILSDRLSRSDAVFYFREDKPWISNTFFAARPATSFFTDFVHSRSGFSFDGRVPCIKTVTNTFGPSKYNRLLLRHCKPVHICGQTDKDINNQLNKGFSLSSTYSFVNEFSFAGMSPLYSGLKYKNSSMSWQTYLKQIDAFH